MTKSKKGQRVRIVSGPWASDCGEIVKATRTILRVKLDTGGKIALVKPSDVQKIM